MFEQKITARDIMTSPVYTVQPTDRVKRVIALRCTHRISAMPVVDRKGESRGVPRDTQEEGGSLMRRMDDRRGRGQAEVERVGGASRRSLPAVDKNTRRERWSCS
jgi:predicted transcriptional regulator